MSARVLSMLFVTAMLYVPCAHRQDAFAMGSKGNVVNGQGKQNGAARGQAEREAVAPGDGLSSRGSVSERGEKTVPAKKPRLKYRDDSKCPC